MLTIRVFALYETEIQYVYKSTVPSIPHELKMNIRIVNILINVFVYGPLYHTKSRIKVFDYFLVCLCVRVRTRIYSICSLHFKQRWFCFTEFYSKNVDSTIKCTTSMPTVTSVAIIGYKIIINLNCPLCSI